MPLLLENYTYQVPPPTSFSMLGPAIGDDIFKTHSPMLKPTGGTGAENMSVPLACKMCRDRHVKCDGLQPTCSRCFDSKQVCFYVPSRRGRRPSKKRKNSDDSSDDSSVGHRRSSTISTLAVPTVTDPSSFSSRQQSPILFGQSFTGNAMTYSPPPQISPGQVRSLSLSPLPTVPRVPGPPSVNHAGMSPSDLRELYYLYFNDSHPIIIPRIFIAQVHQTVSNSQVDAAILYIGSQYSSVARDNPVYLQRLQSSLFSQGSERNKFTVQALILLGIVQRAVDRNDLATETFGQAIDLAMQLGMNRASFAQENSDGSVVMQEMWRRVWWELYVNEALLARVNGQTYFRLSSVDSDVQLPWEEENYRKCHPGVSHSLKEMDDIAFFDDEAVFSSFGYRVSAARAISSLLKLNQQYCEESSQIIVSLDMTLNNFIMHMPESKKSPIDREGRIDEVLFQAYLIAHTTSICLHRPRSGLIFQTLQDAASCTPSAINVAADSKAAIHSSKAIQSANRISNLITMPGEMLQHSPLFASEVTIAAVVQLSAYVLSQDLEQGALIRDRIALCVGALKAVRYTWSCVDGVLQHLRTAAKEVMTYGRPNNRANSTPIIATTNVHGTVTMPPGEPWMAAMSDPIYTQIPDLMPNEEPGTVSLEVPNTYA